MRALHNLSSGLSASVLAVLAAAVLLCAHGAAHAQTPSIYAGTPAGQAGPQNPAPQAGLPVQTPFPIADWWFSAIFKWSAAPSQVPQGNGCNPLPFNMKPGFNGMAMYLPYPEAVTSTDACGGGSTTCPGFQAEPPPSFSPEVNVGLASTAFAPCTWPNDPDVAVQGFSTWSFTMDVPGGSGGATLRATAARGSPYVWVEFPNISDSSQFNVPIVEVRDSSAQLFAGMQDQPFQVWTNSSNFSQQINAQTGDNHGQPNSNITVVSVNGRTYALIGPAGTSWSWKNFTPQPWSSATFYNDGVTGGNGSRWVVVAALPANMDALVAQNQMTRQQAVQLLADHAYFRPDNSSRTATRLTCSYTPGGGGNNVQGMFTYEQLLDIRTQAAAPSGQETLFALFPHQVANLATQSVLLSPAMTYSSAKGYARPGKEPRGGFTQLPPPSDSGQMLLAKGSQFALAYALPAEPAVVPPMSGFSGDQAKLASYLQEDVSKYDHGDGIDTYNWGKHLARLANNLAIAVQTSSPTVSSYKSSLTAGLSGWFTAYSSPGNLKPLPTQISDGPGYFTYNQTWGTCIGYPAGFGSNTFLNDHHFHYGYFLRASAVLAGQDSAWRDTYKPFVELLVRDLAADYNDSATVGGVPTAFAAYNYFDPYAGHSNAAGVQQYANGINQESSSEAVNAWYGMLLWGTAVNDANIRARAAFMYCSEADSARRYWFQEDSQVAGTNPVTSGTLGNVFDNVYQYGGFSPGPQYLHIINWLPFGGGAQYLCKNKPYAEWNYSRLVQEYGSTNWSFYADLIWMYRAISNPADAQAQFSATIGSTVGEDFTCDSGNTLAMTYLWIWSDLGSLGGSSVFADLDHDGDVDGTDLGLLLGAWGATGVEADLDSSGTVDGTDLGLLLGAWTS